MTRALQTIPQEPEADTSAEIYLTGAYFLLPLERYNRLDVALYRNATAIWCAEWYNAIGDRESCVRTYAHARPGTPAPCQ